MTLEISISAAETGGDPLSIVILTIHRPYVTSTHTPVERECIESWMKAFVSHVNELCSRYDRVVVCGDFNDNMSRDRGTFDALLTRGFVNALAGTTEEYWPTQYPSTSQYKFDRLDYIFVSPALCRNVIRHSGRVLSEGAPSGDHVPVEVTFSFSNTATSAGPTQGLKRMRDDEKEH